MCIRDRVYALAIDSSNNQLYVGGNFGTVQDTTNTVALSAKYVARWDISNNVWRQLGNTVYNGTNTNVYALALDSSNNQLYVGGGFTTVQDISNTVALSANYVARWDISNNVWKQLVNGVSSNVYTFTFNRLTNQLYLGGSFTSVYSQIINANRIARWDIANNVWARLGNYLYNGTNSVVKALALDSSNNRLYVGGNFTLVQDTTNTVALSAKCVARWDISNNVWRQFGNTAYNGTSAAVQALALDSSNNQLYVGGQFTTVQDISNTVALSAKYVARWDISNNVWRQLGNTAYNGTNNQVYALAIDSSNNQLYVGGNFGTVQDISNTVALSANCVARWDISNNVWRQFGNTAYNGTNNIVNALALDSSNNQLYVGGAFITVQDTKNTVALSAKQIARWDISNNV